MDKNAKNEILNGRLVAKKVAEQILGIRIFSNTELPRLVFHANKEYLLSAKSNSLYMIQPVKPPITYAC